MDSLVPLNLQLCAQDPEQTENKGEETPQTFDDVLKDKGYQAEFDRRISKALETAKTKWQRHRAGVRTLRLPHTAEKGLKSAVSRRMRIEAGFCPH